MPAFIIADRGDAGAEFMAADALFIRPNRNCELLLRAHFPQLFELGGETNSQRAFRTQIVQQLLGLVERLSRHFFSAK
jgi:hypothetical protein